MAKDYVENMETDAKFPLDYSWHSVNNFVFSTDVSFEDLQACCLGLAAKLEAAQHSMHWTAGIVRRITALEAEIDSLEQLNSCGHKKKFTETYYTTVGSFGLFHLASISFIPTLSLLDHADEVHFNNFRFRECAEIITYMIHVRANLSISNYTRLGVVIRVSSG